MSSASKAEGRAAREQGAEDVGGVRPRVGGPYHTPTGGAPGPCAGGSLVMSPAPSGSTEGVGPDLKGPTMLRTPHQVGDVVPLFRGRCVRGQTQALYNSFLHKRRPAVAGRRALLEGHGGGEAAVWESMISMPLPGHRKRKVVVSMSDQRIQSLMASLESMAALAGDVMDGVALIRAEVEQMYDRIEQPYHNLEGNVSA